MSDSAPPRPLGAVFLSYAREDADAARRIADALRGFGVEVWFDQAELRGGDAWDAKIKQQIRECRLFLAIVSARTQERAEGYFRREWKLAVERTNDLAAGVAFIVPVVVDDTTEGEAAVPDEFMRVQWTRLPQGNPSPHFVEQVKHLLTAPRKAAVGRRAVAEPVESARMTRTREQTSQPRRWPAPWAWVVGAIAIGAILTLYVVRNRPAVVGTAANEKAGATKPVAASAAEKSIAVLPFENLSTEPENAFFASGVHEDVLTNLQKIRSFRVISRTSVLRYREHPDNLRQIARELGVNYIMEGSVRRAGNRVLVTAQLIDARTDAHLWADNFEEELRDMFAIQRRIAEQIATQLQTQLSPDERAALAVQPTTSVEAFKLFQQGRDLLQGTGVWGVSSYGGYGDGAPARIGAMTLLKGAVKLDPNFHRAWVELVEALDLAVGTADASARPTLMREAEDALARTHRIAPDDPWTHYATANHYYLATRRFDPALEELKLARAGRPNEAEFARLESRILRLKGDIAEAVAKNGEGLKLDPHSLPLWREHWENDIFTRQYPDSVTTATRLISLDPTQIWPRRKFFGEFLAAGGAIPIGEATRLLREFPDRSAETGLYGRSATTAIDIWEWYDDRPALLARAAALPAAATPAEKWLVLLALQNLGESAAAEAVATSIAATVPGDVSTAPAAPIVLASAITSNAILGRTADLASLIGRLKAYIANSDTDARVALTGRNFLIASLQIRDREEAVSLAVANLDASMNWMGLDYIAAYHWQFRPLLTHPRFKALIVKQGKWLPYLAERVPEYAEFKKTK